MSAIFDDMDSLFGTTLLMLLLRDEGADAIEWEAETIGTILDDKDWTIGEVGLAKLLAAREAATSDMFWYSPQTFIDVSNGLAGVPPSEEFDPATVEEFTWAMLEAHLLFEDHSDPSLHVLGYIKERLREEQFAAVPPLLEAFDITLYDPEIDRDEILAIEIAGAKKRTHELTRRIEAKYRDYKKQIATHFPEQR